MATLAVGETYKYQNEDYTIIIYNNRFAIENLYGDKKYININNNTVNIEEIGPDEEKYESVDHELSLMVESIKDVLKTIKDNNLDKNKITKLREIRGLLYNL